MENSQSYSSLCHDYFAAVGKEEMDAAFQVLMARFYQVFDNDLLNANRKASQVDNYIPHHFNNVVEKRLPTVKTSKRPKSIAFQRFLTFKAMADKPTATVAPIKTETKPVLTHFANGKSDVVKYTGKLSSKESKAMHLANLPGIEINRHGKLMQSNRTGNEGRIAKANTIGYMLSAGVVLGQKHQEQTTFRHNGMQNYRVPVAQQLAKLKQHHEKLTAQHIVATANGNFERASKLSLQIAGNEAKMRDFAIQVAALSAK